MSLLPVLARRLRSQTEQRKGERRLRGLGHDQPGLKCLALGEHAVRGLPLGSLALAHVSIHARQLLGRALEHGVVVLAGHPLGRLLGTQVHGHPFQPRGPRWCGLLLRLRGTLGGGRHVRRCLRLPRGPCWGSPRELEEEVLPRLDRGVSLVVGCARCRDPRLRRAAGLGQPRSLGQRRRFPHGCRHSSHGVAELLDGVKVQELGRVLHHALGHRRLGSVRLELDGIERSGSD
mmetsp:Transcript_109983/g.275493  ORF Transcript_109983/g.275493 Transcript_109983/m.275493 type:complete len:233 (+) Transcript_109983:684-1382(+)